MNRPRSPSRRVNGSRSEPSAVRSQPSDHPSENEKQPAWLTLIVTVTSQTVLLTAVLYYFGWAHTAAHFAYFGVDTSLLGFSTTDYLLRSAATAFPPLVGFSIAALALFALYRKLVRLRATSPRVGRFIHVSGLAVMGAGALLAVLVLGGVVFPDVFVPHFGAELPLMLTGVVICFVFAPALVQAGAVTSDRPPRQGRSPTNGAISTRADRSPSAPARTLFLAIIASLAFFWWVAQAASNQGLQSAEDSARSPEDFEVLLYSVERIAIQGPGVRVDSINQPGSKYKFRYSGLRLLIYSNGKYILLPQHWQHGRDSALVINEDDSVRVDLITPSPG